MLRTGKTLDDYKSIKDAVFSGEIDIRDAQISELIVPPVVSQAIQSLKENSISELKISSKPDCKIGLADMFALSQALASNTSLKSLDLSENSFASLSCRCLSKALACNTSLKRLILSKNERIDHLAINELLPGLKKNSTLRELIIQDENGMYAVDVINILESSPNLAILHVDLFSGILRVGQSRVAVLNHLISTGLFSLLMKNFTLCGFDLGNHFLVGANDPIYEIIVRRNRSAVTFINGIRGEIMDMKLSTQEFSLDSLKSAYYIRINASEFKVLYQGGVHSLIHKLESEHLLQSEINQFLRNLKCLSECVYVRDVVLADADDETKLLRFNNIILHSRFEQQIYGFTRGALKKQAEAYYRTTTDEDFTDAKASVIKGSCYILEEYQKELEKERLRMEERAKQYEFGDDPNDEVSYSVSRWKRP